MSNQLICTTCGTYMKSGFDPAHNCPTCSEERQYVPITGQAWTSEEQLQHKHRVNIIELNSRVVELVIEPTFAIGQRAFLIKSPVGNILWDCIPLLSPETIAFIQAAGGLKGIAFSHPHYYSNMNEWAATFNCPIFIHASDAPYIHDHGPQVQLWEGQTKRLWDDLALQNIGGHFDGSSVLQVPSIGEKGSLFIGDTLYLSLSLTHFAAMYSYPNRIPLPIAKVQEVKARFGALDFDAIYGFYSYQNVLNGAYELVQHSLDRYV